MNGSRKWKMVSSLYSRFSYKFRIQNCCQQLTKTTWPKELRTEVVEYITKFNKKILTNKAADGKLQFPDSTDEIFLVETKSVELPGAGIIAEIILEDAGVDNQKAAFVQIELQCIDVVMSNGSVEN